MRLSHAMIYVKDLPRMVAFYTGTLGLKPIEETRLDNWVEFETGGARFSLHAIPAQIAAGIEISSPPKPRETSPVKLFFEVDDVAAERRKLEALGVQIIERPWGGCDGVDPEGNIFEIDSGPRGASPQKP
jgi:catechol 2,3-dioxygenase-like lactoylglutathione lyase family enzyme